MGTYLTSIWQCRHFWLSLVQMDLQTRYRRSILGVGWSLLHPMALTAILWTVFHSVFIKDVPNYAIVVLTGLVWWNFITTVTLTGCQAFFQAESYIRQCPAPLAIFPLRSALGSLIHFLLALLVVLGAALLSTGLPNPVALLALIPGIALLFVLGWSLALIAGCANVLFKDTEHLAQVFFQILFYGTPIIYPAKMLSDHRLGWLLQLNPLLPFLELLRAPILEGRVPWHAFLSGTMIVLLLGGAAMTLLRMLQRKLIFYL